MYRISIVIYIYPWQINNLEYDYNEISPLMVSRSFFNFCHKMLLELPRLTSPFILYQTLDYELLDHGEHFRTFNLLYSHSYFLLTQIFCLIFII